MGEPNEQIRRHITARLGTSVRSSRFVWRGQKAASCFSFYYFCSFYYYYWQLLLLLLPLLLESGWNGKLHNQAAERLAQQQEGQISRT